MPDYEHLRNIDTRWTPLTEEVRRMIERLQVEGGSWRVVAEVSGIRTRYIRRLRQREPQWCKGKVVRPLKAVSYMVLDRLMSKSDQVHRLQSLPWFTIEEMRAMGLWNEPLPNRKSRNAAR